MVLEILILKTKKFQFGLSRHIGGFKLYSPFLFVAVNRHEHLRQGD